jgi:hypothetical protein
MFRLFLCTFCAILILCGCLSRPPAASLAKQSTASDRLLLTGMRELSENRPPVALETLLASHPHSDQAEVAAKLLEWKKQRPQLPTEGRKSTETELRELREENRRLRSDLEQLRKLLIDTERRAH